MTKAEGSAASEDGERRREDDPLDIHPLDLRGLRCPLPVLRIQKALRALREGETLRVLTNDSLAAIDIPAFCAQADHRLVETKRDGAGGDVFLIEKAGRRPEG